MYRIEICERFEDWYIEYIGDDRTFNTLDEALENFTSSVLNLINDKNCGSGIDEYLLDNHQDSIEDDIDWVNDYTAGFAFSIEEEEESIAFLFVNYDPNTKLLSADTNFEISYLEDIDEKKVRDCFSKVIDILKN